MSQKVDIATKLRRIIELHDYLQNSGRESEIVDGNLHSSSDSYLYKISVNNYGWYNVKTKDGFATVFDEKDVLNIVSERNQYTLKRKSYFDEESSVQPHLTQSGKLNSSQSGRSGQSGQSGSLIYHKEKRPVGRPPKIIDPNATPKEKRPVGRPPKVRTDIDELKEALLSRKKHATIKTKQVIEPIYPFFEYLMSCIHYA
jgi:hypothetical protein